jgi:competence protein ComEA
MWARTVALGVNLLLGAAVFAASISAADKTPPADPGKKLVEEICSFCHGLARLKGQAYTRDQWSNVVKGMVSEGAPVTDEEFSLILDYLAKNFGPSEQGKEEK